MKCQRDILPAEPKRAREIASLRFPRVSPTNEHNRCTPYTTVFSGHAVNRHKLLNYKLDTPLWTARAAPPDRTWSQPTGDHSGVQAR